MPTFQLSDLLVAVISAAAFALVIFYAVRSRRTRLETRFWEALAGEGTSLDGGIFSNVLLERPFSPLGVTLSTALHLVAIVGTPLLSFVFYDKLPFDPRKFDVRLVEFRLPERLFYSPSPDGLGAAPKNARARARKPAATVARKPAVSAALQASALALPRLQLPVTARARTRDVVIQPDRPPDLRLEVPRSLPTAFLWAQAPAPLDAPRVAGASQPPTAAATSPRSQPAVQRPNRETAIADLQAAPIPRSNPRPPPLTLPTANVAPVKMPGPLLEAPSELPASALPPGNPMNLIAVMSTPAPPSASYLLEAGNRLAAPADGASGATGAAPGAKAPGLSELLRTDPSRTATEGTNKTSNNTTPGIGDAAKAGNSASSTASITPAPKGNLGIIIVRQSPQEPAIDADGVLSGQPVYTVYFEVPGSPRKWLLHYCVPGSGSAKSFVKEGDSVIRVLPKRSVQPPFPLDRLPVDLNGYRGEIPRLIIYALVNERGETENIRLVRGTGQDIDARAMAVLSKWTFRPARRNDLPVAVEGLFGIPLN